MYYREVRAPTNSDIAIIEQSARLASIAIERTRAETALRESATRMRRILDTALDAVIGIDDQGRIIDWNTQAHTIFGWTMDEALGRTLDDVIVPERRWEVHQRGWGHLLGTGGDRLLNRRIDMIGVRRNGEEFPVELKITQISLGDVRQFCAFIADITERKTSEVTINKLAFYDQLTGLPNRTLLLDRLKQTMASSSRTETYGALIFIDLDNFKSLNDTLGHGAGDLLLKQIADRLMSCVRAGDTIARLGGDEFVVVLAGLDTNEVEAASNTETVAEKILDSLSQTYELGNIAHNCTASIGVTLFTGDSVGIDDLMKQADLTMYRAKAAGRNTIRFYDSAMEITIKDRAAMESDLRRALVEKQFQLYYQAQVAGDGNLTGAEVLIRWLHPQRGIVSPIEFIPLAEETGVILPIGLWVLETACGQLASWSDRSELAHLTLSVNVSAHQFRQSDFASQVLAVLATTGADPQRLKLELTESLLVHDIEEVIEKMFILRAKGVGFSLDDFGTGYSSLSYLKRLPLDQLKIDRSFVRDILVNPSDAAIARTIVTLAESLGLNAVAEGVETKAQQDFLASAGCHAYQGYLFSRPLPLNEFEKFARSAYGSSR
jgi:diguanylate cyclase (GGDEF)-like protein/PAS domain S-box-containing protein